MAYAKAETAYKSVNDESTVTPWKKILKWTGVVLSHPSRPPFGRWTSIGGSPSGRLHTLNYQFHCTKPPFQKKKKKTFLLVSGWGCVLLFWDLKKGHPLVPAHLNFIYWCYCSSTFDFYSVNCAIYCCCFFIVADRILMSRLE